MSNAKGLSATDIAGIVFGVVSSIVAILSLLAVYGWPFPRSRAAVRLPHDILATALLKHLP